MVIGCKRFLWAFLWVVLSCPLAHRDNIIMQGITTQTVNILAKDGITSQNNEIFYRILLNSRNIFCSTWNESIHTIQAHCFVPRETIVF